MNSKFDNNFVYFFIKTICSVYVDKCFQMNYEKIFKNI